MVGGIKKYGSLTIADFVRYIVQYISIKIHKSELIDELIRHFGTFLL